MAHIQVEDEGHGSLACIPMTLSNDASRHSVYVPHPASAATSTSAPSAPIAARLLLLLPPLVGLGTRTGGGGGAKGT